MKKFQDYQTDTVIIDGDKAKTLKGMVTDMDKQAEKICQELNSAVDTAMQKFKDLERAYEPQIQGLLKGTDLEGADVANVDFEIQHLEKHNIAFARQTPKNPLQSFLDTLKSHIQNGPHTEKDGNEHIIVEDIDSRTRH